MNEIVTAKQISEGMLNGMKTPNRVLEDAKLPKFPEALKNISRKPLVWDKEAVRAYYFGNSEPARIAQPNNNSMLSALV